MFQLFLNEELQRRIGSRVEVGVDDRLIEGILTTARGEFITVVETTSYTPSLTTTVPVSAIEFIRFPAAA